MRIPFLHPGARRRIGEEMVREHSRWLTSAVRRGLTMTRIPTRRVDEGGFESLMTTPEGRAFAEDWWAETLGRSTRRRRWWQR